VDERAVDPWTNQREGGRWRTGIAVIDPRRSRRQSTEEERGAESCDVSVTATTVASVAATTGGERDGDHGRQA